MSYGGGRWRYARPPREGTRTREQAQAEHAADLAALARAGARIGAHIYPKPGWRDVWIVDFSPEVAA